MSWYPRCLLRYLFLPPFLSNGDHKLFTRAWMCVLRYHWHLHLFDISICLHGTREIGTVRHTQIQFYCIIFVCARAFVCVPIFCIEMWCDSSLWYEWDLKSKWIRNSTRVYLTVCATTGEHRNTNKTVLYRKMVQGNEGNFLFCYLSTVSVSFRFYIILFLIFLCNSRFPVPLLSLFDFLHDDSHAFSFLLLDFQAHQ